MPDQARVLIDEDVHLILAEAIRKRGFDAIHVNELERDSLPDHEQLAFAVEQRRCILTFNVADFVILHSEYIQADKEHFGILVSRQRPIGAILRITLGFLQSHTFDELQNQLFFL